MRWAVLAALALAGCDAAPPVPHATAHPVRVMSVNQCTDQLVLLLLPPSRIASVSWLSRDPSAVMARAAARVAVNHGTAEEVLAERPDLVVSGTFSTPGLRALLRRLGYPLLEVDEPQSLADIRRVTRQVAARVGERARGEALIAAMDAELAALARAPGPTIRVAAWDRGGVSGRRGTLLDAVLTRAGAANAGADAPVTPHPDVEALLAAAPALLVRGTPAAGPAALGDDLARHPLVRRFWRARTVTAPQTGYVCGTPLIADAALAFRGELRAAAARRLPPLPFAGSAR